MEYLPKKAKIIEFRREAEDGISIRIDFRARHEPGQFMQMGIPGMGEAPISIASYSDKFMEFHIHVVGRVTNALAGLKKGDHVTVRGPYGKGYPMEQLKGNSIVMVGGGCGVAPLKGIVDYIGAHRKDYRDVMLFFGYRSPSEILFRKDVLEWKKEYNLSMSVDRVDKNTCFDGRVGFITDILKDCRMDSKRKAAFICGPPIMMDIAVHILKEKGFDDKQIFISAERMMHCAVGVCGHCMIHGRYTCLDGPVFRYDDIAQDKDD